MGALRVGCFPGGRVPVCRFGGWGRRDGAGSLTLWFMEARRGERRFEPFSVGATGVLSLVCVFRLMASFGSIMSCNFEDCDEVILITFFELCNCDRPGFPAGCGLRAVSGSG